MNIVKITENIENDEMALYLFHEGTNFEAYRYLGFHIIRRDDGMKMAVFRTWAPNAAAVFLVGDFNSWEESLPMEKVSDGGVYEVCIPAEAVRNGENYKFKIRTQAGEYIYKADPYAFYAETPPLTASKIVLDNSFEWTDTGYLEQRRKSKAEIIGFPLNIYEVHAASWKRGGGGGYLSYNELASELIPYIKQMGYTHVQFMPFMEYYRDDSYGYGVTGYYAPTSRFGKPCDLKHLINRFHSAGIGVILDWSPFAITDDPHGLMKFDGMAVYENGQECDGQSHMEFSFDKPEVKSFLFSNAVYWLKEFHIDGLCIDAFCCLDAEFSAQAEFYEKLCNYLHSEFPDVLITLKDHSDNFGLKWDMHCINGMLECYENSCSADGNVFPASVACMCDNCFESDVLPLSHNLFEKGKKSLLDRMPGDYWRKFAYSRLFLSNMMFIPGKKLTFMGTEIGQFREWDYASCVEWFLLGYEMHKKHQLFVRDINSLYYSDKRLWQDGGYFERICDFRNEENVLIFRRSGFCRDVSGLIIVMNFACSLRESYNLSVPCAGKYREVFSSDSNVYGGSGCVNGGLIASCSDEENNNYIKIKLPPLAAAVFELAEPEQPKKRRSASCVNKKQINNNNIII